MLSVQVTSNTPEVSLSTTKEVGVGGATVSTCQAIVCVVDGVAAMRIDTA